ncbi:MAG: DUF4351 domain-containing protein [Planctomycetia bacterium]|nr:DUF4351 domain-containing protein [Planctomycetia bacterium]
MDDHDQRFKSLLRASLADFFALFFPDWAPRFDFADTEWLEQEAFLDPPAGEKRVLDVVAKVPTRVPVPDPAGRSANHSLVVIDVEIEWPDRAADIRPRMLWYYEFLRRQHSLPVVPVCLFLRVGLNGIGWDAYEERLWDHVLLRFEYAYIGLPALDGMPYYRGDNLLGVALSALMKLPAADRARIKAEGLARIARSQENSVKKELLTECFHNYLKLDPAEVPEFERLQKELYPEGKQMINTIEERGRLLGKQDVVRKQLAKKFGPLPQDILQQIETLSVERLDEILLAILDAKSLKELGLADE